VTWTRLAAEQAPVWDALMDRAGDATFFQAPAWGEHKRAAGWEPELWITQGGAALSGMQVLLKRLPLGRRLAWVPGGPMTELPGCAPELAGELLGSWLAGFRKRGGVYARFRLHRPASPDWAARLGDELSRPGRKINSGVTLRFELSLSQEELRRGWTSKHRYYVKQAEAAGLEWTWGNDAALVGEMTSLYREMAAAKALSARLFEPEAIGKLSDLFGDRAVLLIGRLAGKAVTGCLTMRTGRTAFYLLAATSAAGREVSAAYAMVPRLWTVLQELGVERFDFGGIDPGNERAKGVDHFKKGFGGAAVEYLGEWDWAPYEWLRRAANVAIEVKGIS
jgi:hypothetical protein